MTDLELSERVEALELAMEQIHAQYVAPVRSDSEPTPTHSQSRGVRTSTSELPSAKDVRAWAQAEGIDVPERGKLSANLIERYKAAQG